MYHSINFVASCIKSAAWDWKLLGDVSPDIVGQDDIKVLKLDKIETCDLPLGECCLSRIKTFIIYDNDVNLTNMFKRI